MRVAVQRFPLLLPSSSSSSFSDRVDGTRDKARRKDKAGNGYGYGMRKREHRVVRSGVDALRRFGFGDVVESSSLGDAFREEREGEDSFCEDLEEERVEVQDDLTVASPILKREAVKQSTKDPPLPSSSIISRAIPPHLTHR